MRGSGRPRLLPQSKRPPARGGLCGFAGIMALRLQAVGGVTRRILHVTGGVAQSALRLVGLAFGFELLVASDLAGAFLDGALCLLGESLHVLAIHDLTPRSAG